jgi:hypothetical protein
MRARFVPLALLVATLSLGACAQPRQPAAVGPSCPAPGQPATEIQLFFGRAKPGGLVSEAEWLAFLDEVVTPAFPDGLTALDAEGRWLDPQAGRTIAEPSKIVVIYAFDRGAAAPLVARIAAAYRDRFQQQSVLTSERPACVAFR